MAEHVLAIDQGTTNTKALLIDRRGKVVGKGSSPVSVSYPRPGWVEQSGLQIWDSVLDAISKCLAQIDNPAVAAIGIANQRESVMLWHRRTGAPIGPCVTWQCRRSTSRIEVLRTPEIEEMVAAKTGLGLDPLFPAAKLGWLLDAYPEAQALAGAGELCAGTIDSWLLFKLTGGAGHVTEPGNASRTQLFDIHQRTWSAELCDLFGLPATILPVALPSDALFGRTVASGPLPAGIPIHAVLGDSHAALFGHGIRKPGEVKATYGTGSSLMALTGRPVRSSHGLSTTIAWQRGNEPAYALEGNISVSAQGAAWVAKILGIDGVEALTALAASVPDSGGVTFVPALVGLGAPHWKPDARAAFSGMSLGTEPAHLARAALEAIAFQINDVFTAMQADLGLSLDVLSVDGGATQNDLLMQIQADTLGRPVRRGPIAELSAMGAAMLAGTAAGLWTEAEAKSLLEQDYRRFSPAPRDSASAQAVANWHRAVQRVDD